MFTLKSRNSSRPVRRLAAMAALALGASVVTTTAASAGTSVVNFTSNTSMRGLGSFSGTATLDNSTDLLTIVLNNTSSRGYLYGVGFSPDGNSRAKDMSNDGKQGFQDIGRFDMKVNPFGKWDAGALVAGTNRHAVAAGASKTMVFRVMGATSETTAFSLLDNPDGESIVAKFRGFRHGVRDHAGAKVVIPIIPSTVGGSSNLPPSNSGGTIVSTIVPTLGGTTGGKTTGGTTTGGTPGGGTTGGGIVAVPLPASVFSGTSILALMAGVMLRRKIGRILT